MTMRSLNTVTLAIPQTDEEVEAAEKQAHSAAVRVCDEGGAQSVPEARLFLQILGLIDTPEEVA
jgi:hypothetical protein